MDYSARLWITSGVDYKLRFQPDAMLANVVLMESGIGHPYSSFVLLRFACNPWIYYQKRARIDQASRVGGCSAYPTA